MLESLELDGVELIVEAGVNVLAFGSEACRCEGKLKVNVGSKATRACAPRGYQSECRSQMPSIGGTAHVGGRRLSRLSTTIYILGLVASPHVHILQINRKLFSVLKSRGASSCGR